MLSQNILSFYCYSRKIQIELNLNLADTLMTQIVEVLKVFKEALIAIEKLFSSKPKADLFPTLSLFSGTIKFKGKAGVLCFYL